MERRHRKPRWDENEVSKNRSKNNISLQRKKKSKSSESSSKNSNNDGDENANSNEKKNTPRAQRQIDPEWIETEARKTVEEELRLDVVNKIADWNDIGWYCKAPKKGKAVLFYPAILSKKNNSQARILLKGKGKRSKTKTIKIQYIGATYRHALSHDEIAFSKWISLSNSTDSENEQRLQNFIKNISKTPQFKNNLLDLTIEKFAVRKMWQKVRNNVEERQREEEEEERTSKRTTVSLATGTATATATALPSVPVTQDSDSNSHNSGTGSNSDPDDDEGYDDGVLYSPGRKQKTQKISLRVGDEIEFYELMGTYGNPLSLRKEAVVGVQPRDKKHPVILSNTLVPLPANHQVRRLPDGCWQPIHDFSLRRAGIQSLAERGSGLHKVTNKLRTINSQVKKAAKDFWKGSGKDNDEAETKDRKQKAWRVDIQEERVTKKRKTSHEVNDDVPVRKSRRSSLRIRSKAEVG